MRDIKFRAYDKYKKEMHIVSEMNWDIFSEEVKLIATGYNDNSCLAYNKNHSSEKCDITALILMQYTGLKDRNMKEIYEGDIVKIDIDRAYVKWNEKYGYFQLIPIGDYYFDSDVIGQALEYVDLEVIGNIYDNKNLLEEGE